MGQKTVYLLKYHCNALTFAVLFQRLFVSFLLVCFRFLFYENCTNVLLSFVEHEQNIKMRFIAATFNLWRWMSGLDETLLSKAQIKFSSKVFHPASEVKFRKVLFYCNYVEVSHSIFIDLRKGRKSKEKDFSHHRFMLSFFSSSFENETFENYRGFNEAEKTINSDVTSSSRARDEESFHTFWCICWNNNRKLKMDSEKGECSTDLSGLMISFLNETKVLKVEYSFAKLYKKFFYKIWYFLKKFKWILYNRCS